MSNTAGRGRGPMGRRRGMSGEKAKDFKGAMLRLLKYMERYKFRLILMVIFAIGGTVFNIIGPKILGKATTELYSGLISKINGGSGIDFDKIIKILFGVMCLYVVSSVLSFIQGFIMTGIYNDVTYNLRKDISKKINKIPMKYFESRTHGEILSRITNDVDTLQTGINQSVTQLITSATTLIGVLVMMLSINVWMTLAALLILPVSMFIISKVMKHSQKYFQDQQKYLGEVNGQVEEIYSGHTVVKAFNKEDDVINEFEKTNEKLYSSAWRSQFFSGSLWEILVMLWLLCLAALWLLKIKLKSVMCRHFSSISETLPSQSSRLRRLLICFSPQRQRRNVCLNFWMWKKKTRWQRIRCLSIR